MLARLAMSLGLTVILLIYGELLAHVFAGANRCQATA
jgi:hypothetical protein